MSIRYDMLEPLSDLNASLDLLTNVFAPLYTECWARDKAMSHNQPFDMNVNVFANMWFSKAMRIFMAYDDSGQGVGYLLAMSFRPLTYQASILQVEDWYSKNHDAQMVAGLFDFMQTAAKFMGVDQIWISHNEHEPFPVLHSIWHKRGCTVIDRYVK